MYFANKHEPKKLQIYVSFFFFFYFTTPPGARKAYNNITKNILHPGRFQVKKKKNE